MVFRAGYNLSWVYSLCDVCLKNAHRTEKMVLRDVASPNDDTVSQKMYLCTYCGSSKKL